jgi:hypothetical protein
MLDQLLEDKMSSSNRTVGGDVFENAKIVSYDELLMYAIYE